MRIVICGSLTFVREMDQLKTALDAIGHEAIVPMGADLVRERGLDFDELEALKEAGQHHQLTVKYDAIRKHHQKIERGDAILVTNWDKKGVPGYIGGNTFLEIGFAYILNKPIYVLHPLPDLSYTDEIHAMQPILLNGDIKKLTV